MVATSDWIPLYGVATGFVHVLRFFACAQEFFSQAGNIFEVLARALIFSGCDLDTWMSFTLFMVFTLPWLILIAAFVFSNTTTTIVSLIVAAVAGIGAFIAGLF